ncbi:response regulator [Burkholderiaceae bacterium DAT-1]|nr:response regulator [Burkholderiaceae bacterium DAT-1]
MEKAKLLLVDDEPFNLEILSEHLGDAGYEIETAEDGESAWQMLQDHGSRYEAILLDRMMPRMNGLEVLQRIKNHAELTILPVILQTAVGAPEAIREGMEAGAYYYLTKPFEREMLLAIVAAAVGQFRSAKTVREAVEKPLEGLATLHSAEFRISRLHEAQRVAVLIGKMTGQPERVALGLTELIINGIEHGNLGVTYDEKKQLMHEGRWADEINARLDLPEFSRKFVRVALSRLANALQIEVVDEGKGFDWQKYMDFDPARAFDPNGRGISMAKVMSFSSLEYRNGGNTAIATVLLEQD